MTSPFMTTSAILAEPSNTYDELRIIAQDEKRLAKEDREAIKRGADEMETAHRMLVRMNFELFQTKREQEATRDRLSDMRKELDRTAAQFALLSFNTPAIAVHYGRPK